VQVAGSSRTLEHLASQGLTGRCSGREALQKLVSDQPGTFEEVTPRSVRILPQKTSARQTTQRMASSASGQTESDGVEQDLSSEAGERGSAATRGEIQEIIVTATKRSQRVQDVPISLTVI